MYFTSVIRNFKGAENLVFKDEIDEGLSLDRDSLVVALVHENEHYSVLDLKKWI